MSVRVGFQRNAGSKNLFDWTKNGCEAPSFSFLCLLIRPRCCGAISGGRPGQNLRPRGHHDECYVWLEYTGMELSCFAKWIGLHDGGFGIGRPIAAFLMHFIRMQEALTFDDLNSVINSTEDLQKQFDLQLPFNRLPYRIGSPVTFSKFVVKLLSLQFAHWEVVSHWTCYGIGHFCCNFQRYQALDDQIRQFYFGNLPIDDTTRDNYLNLLSDMNFVYDCVKGAKIHSQKSRGKTFYYLWACWSFQYTYYCSNASWISLSFIYHHWRLFIAIHPMICGAFRFC